MIKTDRLEKFLPLILSLLFLFYFIAKALLVPITHDEASSCLVFSAQSVKSILSYDDPWPTNHILNTLAVKLTAFLFGLTQFTGRLPNLISSIFYLFFVYKISRLISSSFVVSITIFLIFLCNPYMNDFFSLARGYGMAVAFMTASIFYLLLFLKENSYKNIFAIMVFGFLTVAANFSFLVYMASLNVILFFVCFYFYRKGKFRIDFFVKLILIVIAFDLLLAAFSYMPVSRMSATNQFRFWGSGGFYSETFMSLFNTFLFDIKYFSWQYSYLPKVLLGVIVLIIVSGFFVALKYGFEKNNKSRVFIISCLLLLSTVGINLTQHKLLGTPYLWGRTALLYVPLIALMTGSGLEILYAHFNKGGKIISWIFIAVISIHLIICFNLKYVKEWQFDQNTFDVLSELKKIKDTRKPNERIRLNTHWLFSPSINFYKITQNLDWLDLVPAHKDPQYDQHDEFYYSLSEEYNLIPPSYKKIIVFDKDVRALFQFSNQETSNVNK